MNSHGRQQIGFLLVRPAAWIALAFLVAGCAQQGSDLKSLSMSSRNGNSGTPMRFGPDQLTPEEMQSEAMSFADTYATICAQSLDALRSSTKRPEVANWALENKLAAATAAYTNATGPNEVVNLLDMVVLVTLKRAAVEDHWIPTLLHEEGMGVLESFKKGESLGWEMAARALTPEQIDETHKLIDQWRADNPGQYYVSHIRFTEFSAARRLSRGTEKNKPSGSIFSLLYLDPLANLDPVAQELTNYRDLTERLLFLVERMPALMGWQAELVASRSLSAPPIREFVNNTQKFADATSRFADTTAKYPEELAAERQAAVAQIADEVTKQRQALDRDLEQESDRLTKLLADANRLVDDVSKTGASINTDTTATVLTSEQASRRVLDHAFRLGLILILVLLVGIPVAVLGVRSRSKRMARRDL